jgi:hypothetical protein
MNRLFSERLNQALDEIGAPEHHDERVEVFSKLIKIPRFKAEALLNGLMMPDETLLTQLANEFEVSEAWLLGKDV